MLANYDQIERGCSELPDGLLEPILIHPGETLPAGIWSGRTLLAPPGAAHARYGVESEALYLLRPDGFVGYRAQPPLWDPFEQYLNRVFGL